MLSGAKTKKKKKKKGKDQEQQITSFLVPQTKLAKVKDLSEEEMLMYLTLRVLGAQDEPRDPKDPKKKLVEEEDVADWKAKYRLAF